MKNPPPDALSRSALVVGISLLTLGSLTLVGCGSRASSPATPGEVATAIKIIENDKLLTPEQKAAKIKRLQAADQK